MGLSLLHVRVCHDVECESEMLLEKLGRDWPWPSVQVNVWTRTLVGSHTDRTPRCDQNLQLWDWKTMGEGVAHYSYRP
jgi:hypothetical protein